jgi:hypothetical protein
MNGAAPDKYGIAVVLTFDHSEQVTQNFAREIALGLSSLGFDGRVLSRNADLTRSSSSIDWSRVQLCISLGPPPLKITMGGTPLYEKLKCPFILYLIDSIFYDFLRFPEARQFLTAALGSQRLSIACAEEDFIDILQAYATSQGASLNTFFIPFAPFVRAPCAPPPPREHRALLVGNLGLELAAHAVREQLPQTLAECVAKWGGCDQSKLERLAEALLDTNVPQNVIKLFAEVLELEPDWILNIPALRLLAAADSYLKRFRRALFPLALAESPIPIDIIGTGWERYSSANPQIRLLGTISHSKLFECATAYSHGINMDPNWGRGCHDRVFTFLAAGMRVLTNQNTFIAALPRVAQARVSLYDSPSLEGFTTALAVLPESSGASWCWADLRTVESHLWANRLQRLLLCVG